MSLTHAIKFVVKKIIKKSVGGVGYTNFSLSYVAQSSICMMNTKLSQSEEETNEVLISKHFARTHTENEQKCCKIVIRCCVCMIAVGRKKEFLMTFTSEQQFSFWLIRNMLFRSRLVLLVVTFEKSLQTLFLRNSYVRTLAANFMLNLLINLYGTWGTLTKFEFDQKT
jgi:hypothetical protein